MAFGFSATVLPQLQSNESSIYITDSQASWIASLSSAGTPVGCLLSGYLMDAIGRRLTLMITEVPLIMGWLLISFATNINMIYIGRLLVGLGSGMVGAPARVYTCEVSQPHLRGMLGALASVGVSTGVLIQYVVGSVTSWNVLAGVSAIIPIVSLLGTILLPETPNYLFGQEKMAQAESSLVKLRGSTCNIDEEIQRMITFKEKNHVEPLTSVKEYVKALLSPSALKPFAILAIYFFVYQWCGVNIITFYAVEASSQNKRAWAIVPTRAQCGLGTSHAPLNCFAAVGCGSTMVVLSVYMYFVHQWEQTGEQPQHSWIPVVAIFVFTISCTLGFLIVPWVMIGEVYPSQVRGIVGGMTTMTAHLSVFSVVKTFPFLKDQLNYYGAFAVYGVMSIGSIAFFYVFLPETKGRTLQEIEDYFCGRTKTLKKTTQSEGA
ncbi:hypothetical protein MSG28_007729 [Choristoneura fumiferana]|uniref:Uncharacterized protein n=1 Tax=Choristoneura fumiferana TaxID=7141 RepID=A0ACC0JYC6_CHOFU|nr:hypothetical protein MSG28_007729 [Choristoneura fumiferana]